MGCAIQLGTIKPGPDGAQTCKGVYTSFGQTSGPCDMEGGGISLPGSALVAGVFQGIAEFASGIFSDAPIIINQAPQAEKPDKD